MPTKFTGQFGGKAKMNSRFDYVASFSSLSCLAYTSSGVLPLNVEWRPMPVRASLPVSKAVRNAFIFE
jgi:hypothetical protein